MSEDSGAIYAAAERAFFGLGKRKTEESPVAKSLHIPLSSAYLCQDCNCVSNCSRRCPACASEVLMGLAGILNRETEPETPEQDYSYVTALTSPSMVA